MNLIIRSKIPLHFFYPFAFLWANFSSASSVGHDANTEITDLASGKNNVLIASGNFNNKIDLDPGAEEFFFTSEGKDDVFLVSLTALPNSAMKTKSPSVNEVNAFPNPSNGKFMIQAPSGKAFSVINVFNGSGGRVCHVKFARREKNIELDLGHYPEGIYYIQGITEPDESFSARILMNDLAGPDRISAMEGAGLPNKNPPRLTAVLYLKKVLSTMTGREKEATIKRLDLCQQSSDQTLIKPLYSIIIEAADIFLGKIKYRNESKLIRIIYLNQ